VRKNQVPVITRLVQKLGKKHLLSHSEHRIAQVRHYFSICPRLSIAHLFDVDNTNRTETPGPIYHPDVSKIKDSHRNVLFGRMERSQLSTPKRFISDKISLTENYGLHSPGPAFYSPEKVDRSPLITITGKEKEVTEFVYPQARRPRFLSKELSVENQGQWSPGPKYAPPSTLSGPKFSFGAQDDNTKTKSHAPRDACMYHA